MSALANSFLNSIWMRLDPPSSSLIEAIERVQFQCHVWAFAIAFVAGGLTMGFLMYAATRRNMYGGDDDAD